MNDARQSIEFGDVARFAAAAEPDAKRDAAVGEAAARERRTVSADQELHPAARRDSPPAGSEVTLTPLGLALSESIQTARYLLFAIVPVGALVGTAIAAYDFTVNELFWAHVREQAPWVRMIAPLVGMFLTGLILHVFRVRSSSMADEVVGAYHHPKGAMPVETAVGKLAASVTTMGLGASAGMEGASKWLGATIGFVAQRWLNRFEPTRGSHRTTLLAGGSAGIAAIFRAPLSGAIMGIESPYKHDLAHEAVVPGLVASAVSFWVFTRLRPATPYFPISFRYHATFRDLVIAVPLGLSAGLASHAFLWLLGRLRNAFSKYLLSVVLRTTVGGIALVGLAYLALLLVGKPVTLHAGLPVANDLLNGRYVFGACLTIFVLKLVATAVTFGSGGVGGLFVPTATIGAALGACWDAAIPGSQPGVFTLVGIAAFAGASYNSLLFSAVFIAEATGDAFLVVPALIASTIAFVATAGISNSRAQRKKRPDPDDLLARVPVSQIMTSRIVSLAPKQAVDDFARSVLLEHHFKALPVVDEDGTLQGVVSLERLRTVPTANWSGVLAGDLVDEVKTLCPDHSVADAKRLLARSGAHYVPIVHPLTYRLMGIVSRTDIGRASTRQPNDPSQRYR